MKIKLLKQILTLAFLAFFCVLALGLSIRGNYGSPNEIQLNSPDWKENGPFELSPERGRFILTYSIVENNSFQFSNALAIFGSPDVAVTGDKKFASLFAPGVSFITMPGYLIGEYFNITQVGTYFIISLFAVINVILIRLIASRMNVNSLAATIGGVTFLFSTPAFAYGVNLYQHHISTFIVLLSLYLLLRFKGFISLALIFFLFALSITVDYPNLFLMFPIAFVAGLKTFNLKTVEHRIQVNIKTTLIIALFTALIPAAFFLGFNKASYGNPFQLSGTLQTIKNFQEFTQAEQYDLQGLQPTLEKQVSETGKDKSAVGFFETRNITNGLYLHFLSPDRGLLYFAPIIFLTLFGIVLAYRKKIPYFAVLVSVIGVNIVLYSMWGDPWGGWAFGSRYLIPSYAVAAIFLAIALEHYKKKILFLILYICLFVYGVAVNTMGAITSSANPPKVEALPLEDLSGTVQKYTYERNIDYLTSKGSKSFIYRTFASSYLTPWQYYYFVLLFILIPSINLFVFLVISSRRQNES